MKELAHISDMLENERAIGYVTDMLGNERARLYYAYARK